MTETEKRHDAEAEEALHAELKDLRRKTYKLERFIRDANAYLREAMARGDRDSIMLSTIAHDLGGLARHDRCFVPRVDGYSTRKGNHGS